MKALILGTMIIVLFFGYRIHDASKPFNGALYYKLEQLKHDRKIDVRNINLFEVGISGLIVALELPQEAYVSDTLNIGFNQSGEITSIDGFLYGNDTNGELRSYLIYTNNQKIQMTMDGHVNATFDPDKRLNQLVTMINEINLVSLDLKEGNVLSYYGKEVVTEWMDLNFIDTEPEKPEGNPILKAFQLTINDDIFYSHGEYSVQTNDIEVGNEDWIMDDNASLITSQKDNPSNYYKLNVIDAALGSRFYDLQRSSDNGETWELINDNPFLNQLGQASGIIFYNDNFGIIRMSGASGSYSNVYLTYDGGKIFEKVELEVDSIPSLGQELGYQLEHYTFMSMPSLNEDVLTISILPAEMDSTDQMDEVKVEFESYDLGKTWSIKKTISQ